MKRKEMPLGIIKCQNCKTDLYERSFNRNGLGYSYERSIKVKYFANTGDQIRCECPNCKMVNTENLLKAPERKHKRGY